MKRGLIIAALLVAGCSSSSGGVPVVVNQDGTPIVTLTPGASEIPSPVTSSEPAPPSEQSAEKVAGTIGCTGFKPDAEPQMFVADQGHCQMGGTEIAVYVFDTQQDSDAWWEVAKSFGLPNVVRVGTVTVDAVNRSNRDKVKAALG